MSRDKTRAAAGFISSFAPSFPFFSHFLDFSRTFNRKTRVFSFQSAKHRQNALFRLAVLNRTDPPVIQSPPHLYTPRVPQPREPGKKPVLRHPLTVSPSPQLQKRDVARERVPRPQRGHPPPDLVKNHFHGHLPSCRHPQAPRSCTSGAASTRHGRRTPCGWWRS